MRIVATGGDTTSDANDREPSTLPAALTSTPGRAWSQSCQFVVQELSGGRYGR
jgi:hypothetical protein